jgi:hypothetical protein
MADGHVPGAMSSWAVRRRDVGDQSSRPVNPLPSAVVTDAGVLDAPLGAPLVAPLVVVVDGLVVGPGGTRRPVKTRSPARPASAEGARMLSGMPSIMGAPRMGTSWVRQGTWVSSVSPRVRAGGAAAPLDASTGAAGTAPPARLRYAQGRAGALTGACLAALFERRVACPSGCGGSSRPCMARSGHAMGHGRQLALRAVPVPCPPPGVRDGSGMAGLVFIPLWRWVGRCGSRAGRLSRALRVGTTS